MTVEDNLLPNSFYSPIISHNLIQAPPPPPAKQNRGRNGDGDGDGSKGRDALQNLQNLTYGLSPLRHLHLHWQRLRGLEHPIRWRERLGQPSLNRPSAGPLLWFHAVSLGEGMAAIPVIKFCTQRRPDINILMTTTTVSAF
ncbi:hypothetical protein F3Y22_tig00109980pilonHSYRG00136 [Hibiscus syriacus]|uniref:3-deoxy-D-manno-octulosonic-acid transferase N-terminal domain-containing protein n=1 Tax=Hibiscus syriacus TaxID=106335 RepID=A0A6A3BPZ1_HIBSY|nr:hypothetical protein F3Y22_tig00109980pilonHSYRG00136 [Hibiscus syriacus]